MKRGILLFLALLHIALGALFISNEASGTDAARRGFPLDDAWIHMVYARSIAEHGAPYYNERQLETGFTSPLWMLALALIHMIQNTAPGLDLPMLAKWLGVAFSFLASWGVFSLAQKLGAGLWGAALAATLNALAPPLAFAQVSGMEVSLACALTLASLIALHDGRIALAGWAIAGAYWARPELGLLLAVALVFVAIAWGRSAFTQRFKDLLALVCPFLFVAGLWASYCYAVSESFLPNTAAAKLQIQDADRWGNFFAEVLWPMPANFLLAGSILLAAGAIAWLRRPRIANMAVLLFPWLFFFAIAFTRNQPRGTDLFFYFGRYGLPALPLLFVAVGAGFGLLWEAAKEPGLRRNGLRGLACVLAALALVQHPWALHTRAGMYSQNCKNIEELQVRTGRWLAENTPTDAIVASHDAGAIRYFSGSRRIVDFLGLNDHELAHDRSQRLLLLAAPELLAGFMNYRGAKHLVLVPTFFRQITEHPQFAEIFEPVFETESVPYTVGGFRHTKMGVWKLREK